MMINEKQKIRYEYIVNNRFKVSGVDVEFFSDVEIVDSIKPYEGELVRGTLPIKPSVQEETPLDTGALYGKCRACAYRIVKRSYSNPASYDIEDVASEVYASLYANYSAYEGEVVSLREAWRNAMREGARAFMSSRRLLSRADDIDICADGGMTAFSPRAVLASGRVWDEVLRCQALGLDSVTRLVSALGFGSVVELREALDVVVIGKRTASTPKRTEWSFDEANWREAVAYHASETEESTDEAGEVD